MNKILTIAGFVLALGSNIVWAFVSYGNHQKKKYASERDLAHFKNNQQQLINTVLTGFEAIEEKLEHLDYKFVELKAYLINKNIYNDSSR